MAEHKRQAQYRKRVLYKAHQFDEAEAARRDHIRSQAADLPLGMAPEHRDRLVKFFMHYPGVSELPTFYVEGERWVVSTGTDPLIIALTFAALSDELPTLTTKRHNGMLLAGIEVRDEIRNLKSVGMWFE